MVSRKDVNKNVGWIKAPQNMIAQKIWQRAGGQINSWVERVQNKGQNFSANNYKSNLNLTTYNPRYPWFDENDYNKLKDMVEAKGYTGKDKLNMMDELYQYYYPQVLNQHWLDKRAEEINKTASENGQAILNWDKNAEYNMKLIDLAQTAKRVRWFAYDYPDDQIIEAMKNEIPDWEQLMLNYLNNWDDTILYKAGLKKTDAQVQLENYNKNKENINNALIGNWRELSDDWVKYLRNYTTLYQIVDEARNEWMGQWMTDNDLLLNLAYLSPEIQEIVDEIDTLKLDWEDKVILWLEEGWKWWDTVKKNVKDFLWWNSETPATLDDLAEEIYVRENRWWQMWKNAAVNWRNRGDSLAKFGYRVPRDLENALYNKNLLQLELWKELTDEEYNQIMKDRKAQNINEVQMFNEMTDAEQQAYKEKIWLDPIIENYYNNQWLIESLINEKWFWYKSLWEVTWNIDMLAWIWASIINPAFWLVIMGTDTFARENQEAFDTLINAQMKQWVDYQDAYDNAVKWAVVVWGINTVIELWLEKLLWWVETSTAKNIKELATRDLNKKIDEMLVKRWILEMLGKWLETQARSSLEEWLEEIFQQLTLNIAESGYDPDKKISEWLWRAFESWALNPMNLLAWWSELLKGWTLTEADKQALTEWANRLNWSKKIQSAYNPKNIISNIKNWTNNIASVPSEIITRTIPENIVEKQLWLTPTERMRIENRWISAGNFMLKEKLAWLNDGEQLVELAKIANESYDEITNLYKNIDKNQKISANEASKMAWLMAKILERSDILSVEYGEEIEKYKQLSKAKKIDWEIWEAIKRDFDALVAYSVYNTKWEIMNGAEKDLLADWRGWLNEKLIELWKQNGVDSRELNNRVSNAIDIRNGLLRKISNSKKNQSISLRDLWFGAILGSSNPISTAWWIVAWKLLEKNMGKIAQWLYNLNNTPLKKLDNKRWARVIENSTRKWWLNISNVDMGIDGENQVAPEIDAWDLWIAPLDTIPDKNVWQNPSNSSPEVANNDLLLSENSYSNTALTPTNEEMTKSTVSKKQQYLNDPWYEQAQTEWYDNWRHDLQNWEERWTDYSDESNQKTEEEHLEWIRNKVRNTLKSTYGRYMTDKQIDSEVIRMEDNWNKLWEDEKLKIVEEYKRDTADWSPAWERDENYEEWEEYDDSLYDYWWIDPNLSADELEMQWIPVEKLREQEARRKENPSKPVEKTKNKAQTKKAYYDGSEPIVNWQWEIIKWPHWYWYYVNTNENAILRNMHDNGWWNYKWFVYKVDIPEEVSKDTPNRSNYFDEDYQRDKYSLDRLQKAIDNYDENLWRVAKEHTVRDNLSKYETEPWHKVFNSLSQIFDWIKNASEFLKTIGYDWIKYENSYWEQYVIFGDKLDNYSSYWYNEDRFLRSKWGTMPIKEWFLTTKPTEVKYIDENGEWLSEQNNKDNLIKVNYHPDWYLTLWISNDINWTDQEIWIEEFKNEPIKNVDIKILEWNRVIRSNSLKTIDETVDYIKNYYKNWWDSVLE